MAWLLVATCTAAVVWQLATIIYNLFFHPLKGFPGPWYYTVSWLPKFYHSNILGDWYSYIQQLHDQYGTTIRIAPGELSVCTSAAWRDIYGFKQSGRKEFPKDELFFALDPRPKNSNIMRADPEIHARMRRVLGPAFTDRALQAQESMLQTVVDQFMFQLRNRSGQVLDLSHWYQFASFDLTGSLGFEESFGCLENGDFHPFMTQAVKVQASQTLLQILIRYPLFKLMWDHLCPPPILSKWSRPMTFATDKAQRRAARGDKDEHVDIMSFVLKANDTQREYDAKALDQLAWILLRAGSETTATALAAITYFLLTHPEKYNELVHEVRQIQHESEITINRAKSLKYLVACVKEGLRLHAPVAIATPRVVPKGGDFVDGKFIPEGTSIGIPQWAAYRMERNFFRASEFIPERWLSDVESQDPRFQKEDKEAFKPFSIGPRDCIGQNIAYAEIQVILAKMLWNFDLELQPESQNWLEDPRTRVMILWQLAPLHIKILPARPQ